MVALTPSPGDGPARAAAIRVEFAGPARQDRLTVLIRLILAVPHFICLGIAGLATQIVIVGGWLVALVMGRPSGPAAEYLVGYHQWKTRLHAYLLLLTDKYPPVGWRNDLYPVGVAVRPGPLNQLAVLFRLILVIPALLTEVVLACGLVAIVMPITWLIVLILGEMPRSLHDAITAVTRYLARIDGYKYLLTSAYPAGLFGDQSAGIIVADYSVPSEQQWQLVLSGSAKALVSLILGAGAATIIGLTAILLLAATTPSA
jgi:hypothetical protein